MEGLTSVFKENLGYMPGEKILIITDPKRKRIADQFYDSAVAIGAEPEILVIAELEENGQEPPEAAAAAMLKADIIILPTTKSLSHTRARREACSAGARVASMPGITEDIISRMLKVDNAELCQRTAVLAQALRTTSEVRIKTDSGTDILMHISGQEVHEDTGDLRERGAFGNLPAGEADLGPTEGTAEGVFIIDGSVMEQIVDEPIMVRVSKGRAVEIKGSKTAGKLRSALDAVGQDAYLIAELGIGTNSSAKITGNTLEDEKVYGTCHIAFGNNMTYGGKNDVPLHIDAIIREPDIYCDGRQIIQKGKFLI